MAFLLMFYAIDNKNIPFCLLDSILWFVIAAIIITGIDIPYTLFNGTSGKTEKGIQTITGLIPLYYLFLLFGVIMTIMFVVFGFEEFVNYLKNKREG